MVGTLERSTPIESGNGRSKGPQGEAIAILAHDIRSPLAAVLSGLNVALEPGLTADSRTEILIHVRKAAESALRLTSDLMDAAILESGRLELEQEWIEMEPVIGTICGMAYREDGPLTPTVRYSIARDARRVWADRQRLTQIVQNLVENAVKFTPPDGQIEVNVKREAGHVCIDVKDTGVGIPPDDLPLLFDRFWQARRWQRGGAGLGLAIVKALTEAHGGKVLVWSKVGQGSTFSVVVPADPRRHGSGLLSGDTSGTESAPGFTGFAPAWESEEE